MRRCPSPCRCSSTSPTPARLSNRTCPTVGPARASPTVTIGSCSQISSHSAALGIERGDDEPVDELVGELPGERLLAVGLPARVDDEHVQVVPAELAPERLDEALLAQVLERAGEHADEAGATARERPRDRVARVAELVRGAPDALLRLRGGLHPAQSRRRRRRATGRSRRPRP